MKRLDFPRLHSIASCQVIYTENEKASGQKGTMKNIYCFFPVAKIFGLAPYSLEVQFHQKPSRTVSLISRIPTFLMIVFYATFICSIFWKNKSVSEISNTANWIQFIPNALIYFTVLVTAESSRLTIESVGTWIADLDERLKFFQVPFKRSNSRIKQLSLFALFLVIFCGGAIAILHFIIGVDTSRAATIFYWLSFIVGKIGLLTFNFMFALYMAVLLERLRMVGKTLEWMIEIPPMEPLTKDFKNIVKMKTTTKEVLPMKVHEMMDQIFDIVEILQEICAKLNSFFGKKVIFTILTAFICLTIQLFYIINNIRHGFQSSKSIIAAAASCSLIFTHVLELWVIFISGHRVKDMWSALIKRVQNSKRKFASNERFKAQIDELVSIMVFTRIEIKAAGLFNIDLSVITSIVSSIATYLVVLVQFKMSEEEARNLTHTSDTQQFNNNLDKRDLNFIHT